MHDAILVEVVDDTQKLLNNIDYFILWKSSSLVCEMLNMLEELSTLTQVRDNEELVCVFENLNQSEDILVVKSMQELYFSLETSHQLIFLLKKFSIIDSDS